MSIKFQLDKYSLNQNFGRVSLHTKLRFIINVKLTNPSFVSEPNKTLYRFYTHITDYNVSMLRDFAPMNVF